MSGRPGNTWDRRAGPWGCAAAGRRSDAPAGRSGGRAARAARRDPDGGSAATARGRTPGRPWAQGRPPTEGETGGRGLAARFSYRRSWSRDRSAARSPGYSTAGPCSFPTVEGRVQTPGRARGYAYNPTAATTGLTAGAAAGFRKRPVPLQEPSRIFRSRRRRADGKRRRERREVWRLRGSCESASGGWRRGLEVAPDI